MCTVALIHGDGIGPEICDATQRVMEASGAQIHWVEAPMGHAGREQRGAELPIESLDAIRQAGVALKGPLLAERCSGGVIVDDGNSKRRHPSINNGLRRELGSFANVRPVQGWKGVSGRYEDLNLVIVRETTEDLYAGLERRIDQDTAEAVKRVTRQGSCRIARFACDYARSHGRRMVTAVHKANVLHLTDGLFLESFRSIESDWPELCFDDRMVDATCYLLVKEPEAFDVLVLPNQYGDIVSDLVAGLIGSLGLAPGANFGPQTAVFEAAHGAAPDIAGQGVANPIGLILSGAMLLDHIGQAQCGARIRQAVAGLLSEGGHLTPDLGGNSSTIELTGALLERVRDV